MNLTFEQPELRTIVFQTGARRGYALPRMLERAGCLHSFHTTMAFHDRPSFLKSFVRTAFPAKRATIDRRTVRAIDPQKVFTNPSGDLVRQMTIKGGGTAMSGRLAQSQRLGARSISRLRNTPLGEYSSPNVALVVDDSGGPRLMDYLRSNNIPIAVDIVVTPMAHEMTALASAEWPGWQASTYSAHDRKMYIKMYEETVSRADLILYPSNGVLEGLRSLRMFDESKSLHVPYALGALQPAEPTPQPGRVFFAGSDPIRKGLPYLAEAAKLLRKKGRDYEFIIAGAIPTAIRDLDDCKELTFLGHISRAEMTIQMARADLFCLPSLAEGTAGVTLEALASGLPCVVTKAAGAPVASGENGLIVNECDADDLSIAIEQIIEDRGLRDQLSRNALAMRGEFSQGSVQTKLVTALRTLV